MSKGQKKSKALINSTGKNGVFKAIWNAEFYDQPRTKAKLLILPNAF